MGALVTILGIGMILVGLHDMYHSLMHPTGKGHLSRWVLSSVWRISKLTGHRFGSAVGPAAMITVVAVWVALQAVGWALIYYPHVPGGFAYSAGIDPAQYNDFMEALYVSCVGLATLGFGDVVATDPWVRAAAPLEALTGFALLTTALTWFTQIYPPLSRRRALALELKSLVDLDYAGQLPDLDATVVSRVLDTLAAEIAKARIDLSQHTETYYFQEDDPDLSLARQLPYALALREAARSCPAPEVRLSADRLSGALEQLAVKLRGDFPPTGDTPAAIFTAYAHDHGRDPVA